MPGASGSNPPYPSYPMAQPYQTPQNYPPYPVYPQTTGMYPPASGGYPRPAYPPPNPPQPNVSLILKAIILVPQVLKAYFNKGNPIRVFSGSLSALPRVMFQDLFRHLLTVFTLGFMST